MYFFDIIFDPHSTVEQKLDALLQQLKSMSVLYSSFESRFTYLTLMKTKKGIRVFHMTSKNRTLHACIPRTRYYMWQIEKEYVGLYIDQLCALVALDMARMVNLPFAINIDSVYETRKHWLIVLDYCDVTFATLADRMHYVINNSPNSPPNTTSLSHTLYQFADTINRQWSSFWQQFGLCLEYHVRLDGDKLECRVGLARAMKSCDMDYTRFRVVDTTIQQTDDAYRVATWILREYKELKLARALSLDQFIDMETATTRYHNGIMLERMMEESRTFDAQDYCLLFMPDVYSCTPFDVLLENKEWRVFVWLVQQLNMTVFEQFLDMYLSNLIAMFAYLDEFQYFPCVIKYTRFSYDDDDSDDEECEKSISQIVERSIQTLNVYGERLRTLIAATPYACECSK